MTFAHFTLAALTTCLVFQLPQASPTTDRKRPPETLETVAGSYFRGNGFVNTRLCIDPEGRFSYHWSADDGGSVRQEGEAEVRDGFVVLHPPKAGTNGNPEPFTLPRYRPIRWGNRLYLISDEEMVDFCNRVNLGLEPRPAHFGSEFTRIELSTKPRRGEEEPVFGDLKGQPEIPAESQKFLLKRPLEGKILESLKDRRAKLDLGSDDGLRVGMKLFVEGGKADAPKDFAIVEVVEVRTRDCIVESNRPLDLKKFEKGQTVFSRVPAHLLREVH
jgi:hypothetical protein